MSVVKILIYHIDTRSANNEWKLVKTQFFEINSDKKITGKKAAQILANNFPEFDRLNTREGLQKHNEGFLAMRPLEKKEKASYHHIWEYALVSEDTE